MTDVYAVVKISKKYLIIRLLVNLKAGNNRDDPGIFWCGGAGYGYKSLIRVLIFEFNSIVTLHEKPQSLIDWIVHKGGS